MVKESVKDGNSLGVTSVNLGILSIIFSLFIPALGVILGLISLIFGLKQRRVNRNSWSKSGIILSIIGIVLSILLWVLLTTVL